ncbi:hypothetical protein [Shewanella sp. NFH-SH190041]|nr:hypothetical protein [Shewanella sp. NFH-SH190041]
MRPAEGKAVFYRALAPALPLQWVQQCAGADLPGGPEYQIRDDNGQ